MHTKAILFVVVSKKTLFMLGSKKKIIFNEHYLFFYPATRRARFRRYYIDRTDDKRQELSKAVANILHGFEATVYNSMRNIHFSYRWIPKYVAHHLHADICRRNRMISIYLGRIRRAVWEHFWKCTEESAVNRLISVDIDSYKK